MNERKIEASVNLPCELLVMNNGTLQAILNFEFAHAATEAKLRTAEKRIAELELKLCDPAKEKPSKWICVDDEMPPELKRVLARPGIGAEACIAYWKTREDGAKIYPEWTNAWTLTRHFVAEWCEIPE